MLESTIKEFLKHRIIKDIKHKNSENRANDGGITHIPQNRGSRGKGRNRQVHCREYVGLQDMPEWFRDPKNPKTPITPTNGSTKSTICVEHLTGAYS